MSASVFPARAGMSPSHPVLLFLALRVPRASGDEPGVIANLVATLLCSPRERG